ncbi:adenylosuccinate synthetase [Candidatus Dojkabacteria bacterium]|jgi:adenylosuccinate synthase|nr:adenylosuccinate synthetase [Candidatus Dojkabacteria bacterium]
MTNFKKALSKKGRRANSVVVMGAIFGDEGKGRITDELTDYFLKTHKKVVVYRDNGGSNAGHTISYNGKKIGLHQIGSGILHKGCTCVLGKGMVIHPIDLVSEINEVKKVFGFKKFPAKLMIDEMAVLCFDTHRALELAFKEKSSGSFGSKAATGRGISPSYADVTYRFPVRVRDLFKANWKAILSEHYQRYASLTKGLGIDCSKVTVKGLKNNEYKVGTESEFIAKIGKTKMELKKYVSPMFEFIKKEWEGDTPFIFEKAQAVGLDPRWGVYPDVTASNCCLDGITYSTEGIVNANDISGRFGVIKSTYSSHVGSKTIPTNMEEEFAKQIRDDANEYGTTTGRPRTIIYLDLPMLSYYCRVGGIEELVFGHMDIIYKRNVKVAVGYLKNAKKTYYRPDQEHLNGISAKYKEMKYWNKDLLKKSKKFSDIPENAKKFISFISNETKTTPVMVTFGPDRHDTVLI